MLSWRQRVITVCFLLNIQRMHYDSLVFMFNRRSWQKRTEWETKKGDFPLRNRLDN